jgi:hypothetical protein
MRFPENLRGLQLICEDDACFLCTGELAWKHAVLFIIKFINLPHIFMA